jgi:hypothetical protein
MNTSLQTPAQSRHVVVHLASIAASILLVSLVPAAALAAPPATVATCAGIKDGYTTLGTQCQKAYEKINHGPANAADRLTSFNARKSVLETFQKALLCNGMYGATAAAQLNFKNGEQGHLMALANLRVAMTVAADPNIPAAYTVDDLKDISIKKQQCT